MTYGKAEKDDLDCYFPNLPTDTIYIHEIEVEVGHRNQGIGTKLLTDFLAKVKKPVIAQAYPYEQIKVGMRDDQNEQLRLMQDRLINHYVKIGFEHISDGWMVFHPKYQTVNRLKKSRKQKP